MAVSRIPNLSSILYHAYARMLAQRAPLAQAQATPVAPGQKPNFTWSPNPLDQLTPRVAPMMGVAPHSLHWEGNRLQGMPLQGNADNARRLQQLLDYILSSQVQPPSWASQAQSRA